MWARGRAVSEDGRDANPELKPVRCREEKESAIVFVHGFSGSANTTWETFIATVAQDVRLDRWDIYSIGYRTRLTVDLPIWTADPKLDVCAIGFRTKLTHPPLERYKAIAVVAHSMGGLVVQRSVLDNRVLQDRISHVVLYGTPSGGLKKARFGRLLKRQIADMAEGGKFIESLRADWDETFAHELPFLFKVIAGSEDSFVPPESSLAPFPDEYREVVPGDHLAIVSPSNAENASYVVFFRALERSGVLRTAVESARLAVEMNDYESVVSALSSSDGDLDSDATVTLALALESLGRAEESIRVVEGHFARGTATLDAVGVLAGRLKRRWLFSRKESDYDRSLALYAGALEQAVNTNNVEQAYYHGINVAFLKLKRGPEHESVSEEVREAAEKARIFARRAEETSWSLATIGEASLMLGELKEALDAYRSARETSGTVRAQHSMFAQALEVAGRVFGESGEKAVREVFEGL